MLRYNRKNTAGPGAAVVGTCFRPSLTSAPLRHHSFVSSGFGRNGSVERGLRGGTNEGVTEGTSEEKNGKVLCADGEKNEGMKEVEDRKHVIKTKMIKSTKTLINENSGNGNDSLVNDDNSSRHQTRSHEDHEALEEDSSQVTAETQISIVNEPEKDSKDALPRCSLDERNPSVTLSSPPVTSSSSVALSTPACTTSPPPTLALDDRSVANIECLGLRLVHLLSNLSSVETWFGGLWQSRLLFECFKTNLRHWISEGLQRLSDGIDGGFRRWRKMLLANASIKRPDPVADSSLDFRWKGVENTGNALEGEMMTSKTRGSRHVFLIRHGQYFSKERSDRQKRLTRLGREQLVLTGQRLREVGFEYDAIVSSTMTRAKESAKIIVDQLRGSDHSKNKSSSTNSSSSPGELAEERDSPTLPLSVDALLEEGAPLPPDPPLDFWQPNAAQFRADGPRIERAFQKYFNKPAEEQEKDSHEIIVCHANVIRYCVCRALQVPPQAWLRMWLNHGSITWLTIRPEGRIVLRALGASGYMPPEKLTAN